MAGTEREVTYSSLGDWRAEHLLASLKKQGTLNDGPANLTQFARMGNSVIKIAIRTRWNR